MPVKYFRLPEKVDKKISKLPLYIQNKIDRSFDLLKENPILGVKLKGELSDYYKLRLGDYRIIYKFSGKTGILEIFKIEHRQGVYK